MITYKIPTLPKKTQKHDQILFIQGWLYKTYSLMFLWNTYVRNWQKFLVWYFTLFYKVCEKSHHQQQCSSSARYLSQLCQTVFFNRKLKHKGFAFSFHLFFFPSRIPPRFKLCFITPYPSAENAWDVEIILHSTPLHIISHVSHNARRKAQLSIRSYTKSINQILKFLSHLLKSIAYRQYLI